MVRRQAIERLCAAHPELRHSAPIMPDVSQTTIQSTDADIGNQTLLAAVKTRKLRVITAS
jgi:hypothetical protein